MSSAARLTTRPPAGAPARLSEPAASAVELPADAGTHTATLGFLRLAVAALLWSGLFVLVVAAGRTPLVLMLAGRDYLYTALVAHVVFALDVWLLSVSAGLWVLGAARLGSPLSPRVTQPALALASVGAAFLVSVPLVGRGQAVMADYVPLLLHPLFLLGLALFFAGIAVVAAGFVAMLARRRAWPPLEALVLACGAAGYLVALAALGLAALRWGTADQATVVWGAGHLFQLVNGSGLIAVWLMMTPVRGWLARSLLTASLVGFALAMLLVVLTYVSPLAWATVANSFWAGLGVPVSVAWLVIVVGLRRAGLQVARGQTSLLFTLALFAIGGLIALPGLENDTRVTAHYHASVGAVTMSYMWLAYQLVPRLGRAVVWPRLARLQPHLYGFGLLLLVGGLYWAGEAGTARKIFEAIAARPSLLPAAGLFVAGALLTIGGGVAFVLGLGLSLLRGVSMSVAPVPVAVEAPAPLSPGD